MRSHEAIKMIKQRYMSTIRSQTGFSLIEMIIVALLLGVLAIGVIPQILGVSEDAKLSNLKTNLVILRKAIQRYHHEHNSIYPGARSYIDGRVLDDGEEQEAFSSLRRQLTQYSNIRNKTSKNKSSTYRYGPYLKSKTLPENPFVDGAGSNKAVMNMTVRDITNKAISGSRGWKYFVKTGILIANDSNDHAGL